MKSTKEWKPVRVTKETIELLNAVKASLAIAHERGQRTLNHGPKGEITNDETIRILAQQFLDHKARSRRGAKVQLDAQVAE